VRHSALKHPFCFFSRDRVVRTSRRRPTSYLSHGYQEARCLRWQINSCRLSSCNAPPQAPSGPGQADQFPRQAVGFLGLREIVVEPSEKLLNFSVELLGGLHAADMTNSRHDDKLGVWDRCVKSPPDAQRGAHVMVAVQQECRHLHLRGDIA
jgi:hypothetical protein